MFYDGEIQSQILLARDCIFSLLQQGLSTREVADLCHVSKSVVQKLRAGHLFFLDTARGGRPSKLSAQDKRFCVRAITSGKVETAISVQKKLNDELSVNVSDRTVRRTLEDAGLRASV